MKAKQTQITKATKKSHIDKCAALIFGTYGKTSYRDYDVYFYLKWESDDCPNIVSLDILKKGESFIPRLLGEVDSQNEANYIDDHYNAIERVIKNTRQYKSWDKRIKAECDWAKMYNKIFGEYAWENDILIEAEDIAQE